MYGFSVAASDICACFAPAIHAWERHHDSRLHAQTTARIIEALEQGTPPWVRPWSTIPDTLPMNAQSHRPYRGINFTMLSLSTAPRLPRQRQCVVDESAANEGEMLPFGYPGAHTFSPGT
jgi:hypothetical protein